MHKALQFYFEVIVAAYNEYDIKVNCFTGWALGHVTQQNDEGICIGGLRRIQAVDQMCLIYRFIVLRILRSLKYQVGNLKATDSLCFLPRLGLSKSYLGLEDFRSSLLELRPLKQIWNMYLFIHFNVAWQIWYVFLNCNGVHWVIPRLEQLLYCCYGQKTVKKVQTSVHFMDYLGRKE